MWVDTRDCVPLKDGIYMVQTVYGDVTAMFYTHEGGWNTHYDTDNVLFKDNALPHTYVARWFNLDEPPAVPKKWKDEYNNRKED